MQFETGDQVVHPRHGVGIITEILDIELVEGFEHYYALEFPELSLRMNIPFSRVEEAGLRPAMSSSKVGQVLETLREAPRTLASNYKERQNRIQSRLASGRPLAIARAVRDLTWRGEQRKLTQRDRRLLDEGRDLLVAEVATVLDSTLDESRRRIDEALATTLEYEQARAAS